MNITTDYTISNRSSENDLRYVATRPDVSAWKQVPGTAFDLLGKTRRHLYTDGQTDAGTTGISDRAGILAAHSLEIVRPLVPGNDRTYLVRATAHALSVEKGVLLVAKFLSPDASVSTHFAGSNANLIPGLVTPLHYESLGSDDSLVVFRYYPLGSLRDCMRQTRLSEEQVREIVRQITSVLLDVETSGSGQYFVHGDIKPENLLLESTNPLKLALTDFDHSATIQSHTEQTKSGMLTLFYAAPETLVNFRSRSSDYWSLGMMVLELLMGKHPFAGLSESRVRSMLGTTWEGKSAGLTGELDENWCALLYALLDRRPERRWSSDKVLRWLDGDITVIAEGLGLGPEPAASQPLTLFPNPVYTKRALARALISDWDEGISVLSNPDLMNWLASGLGDQALASRLRDLLDDQSLNDDERLVRLAYFAYPGMEPCWRGIRLGTGTLQDIALQALDGRQNALDHLIYLRDNAASIAASFHELGIQEAGQLVGHWTESWERYQNGWEMLVAEGAPDERPDEQAALPALVRLWLSEDARVQLRKNIGERSDAVRYLLRRDWYFALGTDLYELPVEHQWILQSLDQSSLVDSFMYSMMHNDMAGMNFESPPEISDEQLSQSVLFSRTTAMLTRRLFPQSGSRERVTLLGPEHPDQRVMITEEDSLPTRLTAPLGRWIRNASQSIREWLQRRFRRRQTPQNQPEPPETLSMSAIRVDLTLAPDVMNDQTIIGQAALLRWDLPAGVHPVIHIGHPGFLGIRFTRQRVVRLPFRRRGEPEMNALERWMRGNNITRLPHRGQIILAFFQPTVLWLRFRMPGQRWRSTRSQALRLGVPAIYLRNADARFLGVQEMLAVSPAMREVQETFMPVESELIPLKKDWQPLKIDLLPLKAGLPPLREPRMDDIIPPLPSNYYRIGNRRVRALMSVYSRLCARVNMNQ